MAPRAGWGCWSRSEIIRTKTSSNDDEGMGEKMWQAIMVDGLLL